MLTDVTLCCAGLDCRTGREARPLYRALLSLGVLVQVPASIAQGLGEALDPARTVLRMEAGQHASPGFAAYLNGCGFPAERMVRELPLGHPWPRNGGIRLLARDCLMHGDYTGVFDRLLEGLRRPVLCVRGDVSFATALTVEWGLRGGDGVVSFAGMDGHADLASVAVALRLQHREYYEMTRLPAAVSAWQALTGQTIAPHQPVVGADVFTVSSGVHVHGLRKSAASYEPYPPEMVGMRRTVLLSAQSGRAAVEMALEEAGRNPAHYDTTLLAGLVRERWAQGSAGQEELLELASLAQGGGTCGRSA